MNYFDLSTSRPRPEQRGPADVRADGDAPSLVEQIVLYGVVVIAVVLSNAITQAQTGQPISLDLSIPWVIVSALIALLTFPAVWHNLQASGSPLLVKMGIAAQGGAFWSVIVASAQKAAG